MVQKSAVRNPEKTFPKVRTVFTSLARKWQGVARWPVVGEVVGSVSVGMIPGDDTPCYRLTERLRPKTRP